VPSAPPAKQPLASMCSRVDKPFEGVLDRGQGARSPETVVTGGGSDVLETGRIQGGIQSPTLTAVSRHGFLAYVELDLLKLAFERSGLLHLMYIYFPAVHCFFLFDFVSRFPPDT
jgi:hypothetical protein